VRAYRRAAHGQQDLFPARWRHLFRSAGLTLRSSAEKSRRTDRRTGDYALIWVPRRARELKISLSLTPHCARPRARFVPPPLAKSNRTAGDSLSRITATGCRSFAAKPLRPVATLRYAPAGDCARQPFVRSLQSIGRFATFGAVRSSTPMCPSTPASGGYGVREEVRTPDALLPLANSLGWTGAASARGCASRVALEVDEHWRLK
jgi:hypothetical protein